MKSFSRREFQPHVYYNTLQNTNHIFNWWVDKERDSNNRIPLSHKTVKPCHLQEHSEKLQDIVLGETNQTHNGKYMF